MIPKQKARELVEKYIHFAYSNTDWDEQLFHKILLKNAKFCAQIAVDEILVLSYFDEATMTEDDSFYKNYWTQVKEEIKLITKL